MRVVMMIEGQEGVTWPQWVALAEAAETAGLDGLFRSDHYTMIHGFPGGALDAWTTIAALAPLTRTLRLGTLVSPATFRHPSLIARIVASIDHISGGRVELGLGTGWYELEHTQNGFDFPPMGQRTQLLAEQVEIVVRSWREDTFDHAGPAYTLKGQSLLPKPVQTLGPPLILGGRAGPKSVALAAKYASEYNAFTATPEDASGARARLDSACTAIGRDPKTLAQSTMITPILGDSDQDAQARAERLAARIAPTSPVAGMIQGARAAGLIGTPKTVAARCRAFEAAGVSRLFVQNFAFDDPSAVALIGELAEAVG